MSALSAAKTILEADATLLAAATGGVWDFDETGRLGLSRSNTATSAAYDASGVLKPAVVIRLRSSTPDGILRDDPDQYVSVREMLEVWFYQDSGYTAIETMRNRVYTLLHAVQLSGTFRCYWSGDVRSQRDDILDASVERSDFVVHTFKT
jgi:hypothetical protein